MNRLFRVGVGAILFVPNQVAAMAGNVATALVQIWANKIRSLLTVLGIISLLTAVLLPAVSTAREAARRIECTNHLKQTGLALHCYHDTYRCLPAGWQWEATGRSAYGWAVALLPWLEQEAPYRLVDRNRPVGDYVNEPARAIDLPVLLCPSDIALRQFELFPDDDLPWQLQSTLDRNTPLLALPAAISDRPPSP